MSVVTLESVERKLRDQPDLELGWQYWNVLLPETTGYALAILLIHTISRLPKPTTGAGEP